MAQEFFARLPPYSKALGSRLLAMVDRWYEELPSLRPYRRARRIRQLYYGLPSEASPFDVTTVGRMGESGELTAINLNRLHHLGQRFLTMGVSEDFGWQPVSANGDTRSQEEAILAGSVLEHEKRASSLEAIRHKFNELALLDGWSWFSVRWDARGGKKYDSIDGQDVYEGRLRIAVHEWWRTVTDSYRQDADHDWCILDESANRYDVAEKYAKVSPTATPEQAQSLNDLRERILSLPPENRLVLQWQTQVRGRAWSPDDSPLIRVYTLFHKPTPAVPEGREVVFLSDGTILLDTTSVYGQDLPAYRVAANEMHGTPYGVSMLANVVALQDVVNALLSTDVTNNVNHGLTTYAVAREAGLNITQMGGASVLEVEGNPKDSVMPIGGAASSPNVAGLAKFILAEMETQTGMNAVSLGRQEHQMAASLAALLDQKAREFAGFFVRSDKLAVTRLGTAILRCYKQFAKAPRVLEVIAGEGRRYMLPEFVGSKLGDIERVTVTVRSGMMATPAGQMAFAENLVASGALKDPQALRTLTAVWQRGNVDSSLAPIETEDMLISRENDLIARGQVPPVRALDNHVEHLKRHREPTANPAARMDEAVSKASDDHVNWHIEMLRGMDPALLQIMGQPVLGPDPSTPPPAPGGVPPGAMPPPGGAPPEEMEGGPISDAMAGNPPNLPQPAQPPPGAPPPLN